MGVVSGAGRVLEGAVREFKGVPACKGLMKD